MRPIKNFFVIAKEALALFRQKNGDLLAAAVSYYAVFSIVPLIFFSVSVVGMIYGKEFVADLLIRWGGLVFASDVLLFLSDSVDTLENLSRGLQIPILGAVFFTVVIILGFNTLTKGLNQMWNIFENGFRSDITRIARMIIFTFVLQFFIVGMIIMESLFAFLVASSSLVAMIFEPILYFSATTLFLAIGYKLLAWKTPPMRSLLYGSAVGTFLFLIIGKLLVWLHLSLFPVSDIFNVAGLLIVILMWIFITTVFIYYGAAFAYLHAIKSGHTGRIS